MKKRGKDIFTPNAPEKYKGRYPIVIRSTWERAFCQWCDSNPMIKSWSSESITIPYFDPVKRRRRRYFPDFFMVVKDKTEKEIKYIVEIKPFKETLPPKPKGKKKKTRLYEERTYSTNQAKWKAAEDYCKKFGYTFKIITEKELFGK